MAFLNKEGLEHLWAQILMKLKGKVDAVEGKGLSTNDFTNEEKEKLATLSLNSDWNIADESLSGAIKNKPFGYVMGMVDVLSAGMYNFGLTGDPDNTDIVCWSGFPPEEKGTLYDVWFENEYLGQFEENTVIPIENGEFSFHSGAMWISGGNYPEGEYQVHIQKKGVVTQKLNSEWLNVQNSLDTTDELDPISCGAVRNVVIPLITEVSGAHSRLNNLILLVTWDNDITHPASHTSAEIYEHIANLANRGIVMLRIGEDDNAVYWPLISCIATYAEFGYVSVEESAARSVGINEDGIVDTYERTLVDDTQNITKEQNWTPEIQEIARNNIGAASVEALGDINTALDTILAIQEELMRQDSVTLITFATPTGTYQAEDGMTWSEWINSQYNIDGFIINDSGWVEDGNGGLIYDYADDGQPETADLTIVAGHTYIYD